jgi:hypothetical protein
MRKLLLLGIMLSWGAAAAAQDGGSSDQCPAASLPVVGQTDVATLQRTDDGSGATIQLNVTATSPDGSALTYSFTSGDGTIAGDGETATWTVSGAGPFSADVRVSTPSGCSSHAHFIYHMEQTGTD